MSPSFSALETGQDGASIRFDISGVHVSVVNALRRTMIADVPTAAFNFQAYNPAANGVLIRANTSCLHNEIIGNRISLIPIGFSENQLRLFEPSHYRFELRAKNETPEPLDVTTADFEVYDHTGARYPKPVRDALFPANPITGGHVFIMRLRPAAYTGDGGAAAGEELHVECTATLGTGAMHARWSPVSVCFHNNKQDPAASSAALAKRLEDMRAAGMADDVIEATRTDWPALDAHRHYLRNAAGDPDVFEFFLRSEAPGLRPAFVVFSAFRVLQVKLLEAARAFRGGEGSARVDVKATPNNDDFFAITLQGEGHTLGNLVQAMLFRKWIEQGDGGREVSYIAYHKPHPGEDHIVFKIKLNTQTTIDGVKERMAAGMDWVRETLAQLMAEWVAFSGLATAGIVDVNEAIRKTAAKVTAAKA